jgi:hypothetical protein
LLQGPQLGPGYVSLQGADELHDLPVHHEIGYNDVPAYHSHVEDYRLSPYQQVCLHVTSFIAGFYLKTNEVLCSSSLTICAEYVLVVVSDTVSLFIQVISSVPQGTVLGAFLFNVLYNDGRQM